jgi:hypothetical protein
VSGKVSPETQWILGITAVPVLGWIIKEVASIRPLKENVDALRDDMTYTRTQVDKIRDLLLDSAAKKR